MKVYEFGDKIKPVIVLLPGTCCYWKTNFGEVIPLLQEKFRVCVVSYDGFDETENTTFPTMLEECAEQFIQKNGLKDSSLRCEYEQKVAKLRDLSQKLTAEGKSEEQIARIMHQMRRELGREYKLAAPPLFREYIYAATEAKYGDPLGPSFEMLCQTKSYRQIIDSASRPIESCKGGSDEKI